MQYSSIERPSRHGSERAIERAHRRQIERHEPGRPRARLTRIVGHDGRQRWIDQDAPVGVARAGGALAEECPALGQAAARIHEREPPVRDLAGEPHRLVGERGQKIGRPPLAGRLS